MQNEGFEVAALTGIGINLCRYASTAGLLIRCTMGLRWHFCCRGPILKPRPVLDFPAQTTRGKVLDFFCKTSKRARYASF